MAAFRRLVLVAALRRALVRRGLPRPAHQIGTVPVLLEAERYEQPARVTGGAHQHAAAWEPQDWRRADGLHVARRCLDRDRVRPPARRPRSRMRGGGSHVARRAFLGARGFRGVYHCPGPRPATAAARNRSRSALRASGVVAPRPPCRPAAPSHCSPSPHAAVWAVLGAILIILPHLQRRAPPTWSLSTAPRPPGGSLGPHRPLWWPQLVVNFPFFLDHPSAHPRSDIFYRGFLPKPRAA